MARPKKAAAEPKKPKAPDEPEFNPAIDPDKSPEEKAAALTEQIEKMHEEQGI